jgi:aspartyl/asparaginyl beta-hydroxylase (cupin superfamily)
MTMQQHRPTSATTAALVRQIPDLNSAFFSILEPGATIPRHRGVTRGPVTCHLGLIIPDTREKCVMKVEDNELLRGAGQIADLRL